MRLFYKIVFKIINLINHEKVRLMKASFKCCGNNVLIYPSVEILGPKGFEIGDNSSIAPNTIVFAVFGVKIGENCLISSNCGISSYNHVVNRRDRPLYTQEDINYSKKVEIGNNVWIGMNACILPGISIGDNSIIGAGSVVTKNIPPNEIWAGNPAKFVKKIQVS